MCNETEMRKCWKYIFRDLYDNCNDEEQNKNEFYMFLSKLKTNNEKKVINDICMLKNCMVARTVHYINQHGVWLCNLFNM